MNAAAFVATSVPLTPSTFTPPVPHTPPVVRTDTSVSTTSTSHTSTSCTRSSGSKRGSKEGDVVKKVGMRRVYVFTRRKDLGQIPRVPHTEWDDLPVHDFLISLIP